MSQPVRREREGGREEKTEGGREGEGAVSSQTPLAECHSGAASKPTRSIICPTFKWNALTKGRGACRPSTHTYKNPGQARGERKKEKRAKEEKGSWEKMKRGRGKWRGGRQRRRGAVLNEIEIPFLCPASYCLAVWLTKAISSKQQVGMKI